MKFSLNNTFTFLLIFYFFLPQQIQAQLCPNPSTKEVILGNKMIASIANNGFLFQSNGNAPPLGLLKPVGMPFVATIFESGLWLGAINEQGELKVTSFYSGLNSGYSAGPIINENGQLSFPCENYDRIWTVRGGEIINHIADFEDDGIIDNPIPSIFSYPGLGNPFFESIHGFALPISPQGLAPFNDTNNDGIYNPEDGDFPLPSSVDPSTIPSQISWAIFNDGIKPSGFIGESLNAEIQLTAWLFNCDDNELLNHTIFTSHKIINRGNENLDSLTVGLFTNYDIGCHTDDLIGSVPNLNTIYAYNQDTLDGTTGCSCDGGVSVFCEQPPVQSTTFLNRNLTSSTYYNRIANSNSDFYRPENAQEYFNVLNGKWKDGTPLTFGGNGYGGSQETSFAFPGNPNDSTTWSAFTDLPNTFIEFETVSSSFVGKLDTQQFFTLDMAHVFHVNNNMEHLEIVDTMLNNVPIVQQAYDNNFATICSSINCTEDCVWAGDADRDSIVTMNDIFQIALAQGVTGTQRNTPLVWGPFESENWGTTLNGIDLKHTDCNGNGIIDPGDFNYPNQYYGNSYKLGATAPDQYQQGNELCILSHSQIPIDQLNSGGGGRAQISISEANNIMGLTFTIEFDTTFLSLDSYFNFNIWDDASNSIRITKDFSEQGELHFISVKNDGTNGLTKEGIIANFIQFSSIPTDFAQVQTFIRLKNIKAILNDGTDLNYGSKDLLVTINNPNGNGQILSNENLEQEAIQISPNPTSNILNIKTENLKPKQFMVFDLYGKIVLEKSTFSTSEVQLPIEHFANGIYFLKIEMDGKALVKKFIKM